MNDFVCHFEASTIVNASPETLFEFHSDPQNLTHVMPPTLRLVNLQTDGKAQEGRLIEIHCRDIWIIPMRWRCQWKTVNPPHLLVDEMLSGPFRVFVHEHHFERVDGNQTRLTDHVTFAWGRGWWGKAISEIGVRGYLKVLFLWRHRQTRRWAEKASGK